MAAETLMTGCENAARSRFTKGSVAAAATIAAVAVTEADVTAGIGTEQQPKRQPDGDWRDDQRPGQGHPVSFPSVAR